MHSITRPNSALRAAAAVTLVGLLLGLALWPHSRAEALTSGARAFSTEEERALRAGELVVRPTEVVRGDARLMGGLSWQLVSAPAERVWRAINDVRTYPRFLPAVEEARLIEQNGIEQRLFIRHRVGFVNASYFVLATPDVAAGRMRFRLDRSRPSSIRDAFGELRVTPYPDGRSVVSLAILADVGEGLVAGLVRSNVHQWMLRVPTQLKKYVEKAAQEPPRSAVEAIEQVPESGRPG
jgi:hypothetical protein